MASIKKLEARCVAWNRDHPIGTRLIYHPVIGSDAQTWKTTTRSEAYVLSGHAAVVFLDGKAGCVSLDACEPATDAGEAGGVK